jgi:hypothetical protein
VSGKYIHQWKELNSKAIQTISTEVSQSHLSFFTLIKKDKTARPPKQKPLVVRYLIN